VLPFSEASERNKEPILAVLREAFADFRIETLHAYETVIDEGSGHRGRSALIDLIARRPA